LFCININETDTSTSIIVVLVFIKNRDLIVVGSEFINIKEKESVVGVDMNGLIVENDAMDIGAFEVQTEFGWDFV
jgi:hypothetical protein